MFLVFVRWVDTVATVVSVLSTLSEWEFDPICHDLRVRPYLSRCDCLLQLDRIKRGHT